MLLGPKEEPHPPGSKANAAVRQRLLKALRKLGLQPQVQTAWACSPFPTMGCSRVHNILARFKGKQKGPALALSAHYDSTPATPGASDDMAGVGGVLEIARLLLRKAPHRNPVILLLTDGEETGLTGAVAFAKHPWSKDIAALVNLEAAGTSGRSDLFQTGPHNAWLIRLFARHAPMPSTHSMLPLLIQFTGNVTDFDIHTKRGVDGANFAYGGDGHHYHTPLDNLTHLNEGSLRHQGENAAALSLALANVDLTKRGPKGKLIYQDIAGLLVLSWSVGSNFILVLLALLVFGGLGFMAVGRRSLASVGEVLFGAGLVLVSMILALLVGAIVATVVAAVTGHPKPWWAIQSTFMVLYTLVAASGILGGLILLGRRTNPWGLWLGFWGIWSLLTLLVALIAAPFSSLFLLPLAGALLSGTIMIGWNKLQHPPLFLPWFATLLIWLPMVGFAGTIGFNATITLPLLFLLYPALPMLMELPQPRTRMALGVTLAGIGVMAIVVSLQPRTDQTHPVGINLVTVHNVGETHSRTQLEVSWKFKQAPLAVIPPKLAKKCKLGTVPGYYATGGYMGFAAYAKTPPLTAAPPKASLSADGTQLTIESQRGATFYQIALNADVKVTLPGGVVSKGTLNMDPKHKVARYLANKPKELRVHRFYGPHQGPLRLTLQRKSTKDPLLLWVGDRKKSVAPAAAALAKLRVPHVLPYDDGDRSIIGQWHKAPKKP